MIYLFYFLAAVLVFLSYKSFRGGIDYLNFFKKELAKPGADHTPLTTIFVPCRGIDQDLRENLSALFRQEYPKYEIVFVVDDEKDEAVRVIEELIKRESISSQLVIASKSTDSSQKVENLREAVLHASPRSEVFVFVDSDARPSRGWLRDLAAPLEDENVGVATGYRWFISKKPGFASEMRVVWNASIASALGENTNSNFCWGGSTAIRREVFETLGIGERWRGTLSDDFTVTRAMKEAGMPIVFVPQALSASVENCTFKEMIEFTTRQMKITRVYSPHLWIASFIGSGLFNLVWIWGVAIILYRLTYGSIIWPTAAALLLIAAFSTGKSWLRLKAVRLVLRDYGRELRGQFLTQNTLWLFSPAVFFYNSAAALFSRRIIWRGTTYELKSATETVVIAPNGKI